MMAMRGGISVHGWIAHALNPNTKLHYIAFINKCKWWNNKNIIITCMSHKPGNGVDEEFRRRHDFLGLVFNLIFIALSYSLYFFCLSRTTRCHDSIKKVVWILHKLWYFHRSKQIYYIAVREEWPVPFAYLYHNLQGYQCNYEKK